MPLRAAVARPETWSWQPLDPPPTPKAKKGRRVVRPQPALSDSPYNVASGSLVVLSAGPGAAKVCAPLPRACCAGA